MRVIVFLSVLLGVIACGSEEECWEGLERFDIREADGSLVCMPDPSEGLERCLTSGSYLRDGERVTLGYYPERDCTEIAWITPDGDEHIFDRGCIAGNHVSDKCDDWRPHSR